MMKKLICALTFFWALNTQAQEMKASVQVVAPGVQMTDKQILTTLQNSIQQFINTRKWTEDNFEAREKIEMSIFLNVTQISTANDFQATLQINSVRPVFNSNYKSTLFSFQDEEVVFKYREFEALEYTEGQNVSDLTSLLAYYVNIVLGYDYDSFSELGGSPYFAKAQSIVNLMQGKVGWGQSDGKAFRNRYYLSENLNNTRYVSIRKITYNYHRKGMDQMFDKPEDARIAITAAIKSMQEIASIQPNSLLQRTFFSSKFNEIIEIYKGATVPEKNSILEILNQLDPTNRTKYEKIKA